MKQEAATKPHIKSLTKRQREVIRELKQVSGGFLRPHINPNGTFCYRLMDGKRNPVINYRASVINRLISLQYINKKENELYLT